MTFHLSNKRASVCLLVLFGGLLCLGVWRHYRSPERIRERTAGWETLKSAQAPFRPGIIVGGPPPQNLEIQVIEPRPSDSIRTKSLAPCHFLVGVKTQIGDSSSNLEPPISAFIKLVDSRHYSSRSAFLPSTNVTTQLDRSDVVISGYLEATGGSSSPAKRATIERSDVVLAIAELVPDAKGKYGYDYVYAGQLTAPRKEGIYAVVIDVDYAFFAHASSDRDAPTLPQRFRKSVQGATLRVDR